jgi:NADH pyrophosphatase NudC (nudix superfamily)
MLDHCPGTANLRTPTLSIKKCPRCGEEVELFSNDVSVKCSTCGFEVYNDILSCVQWCRYAKECVGEETYTKIMAQMRAQEQKK